MIGIVVHLEIQDGKQADFEAVAKDLVAKVKANEPGTLMYDLFKKQGSETDYYFLEKYADADALAAHGQTDYFKAAQPGLGACLAGRPTLTRMDGVE
ncbi:MAG: antibiotic biosynthesis monooxygenase [Ponticaulis sp.]|nr:antibiotic biosynthesis monooxygenase [Ponticaulis sp.]